jgi:uncharacterized protein (DUF305 family)
MAPNEGLDLTIPSRQPQSVSSGASGKTLLLLAGLSLTLAIVAVVAVASLVFSGGGDPADNSVDAGFARDMAEHHAQAVLMAGIAYRRTEDPEVRMLAYDILTTQQAQIGVMNGWLMLWDLPTSRDGEPMAWMGHEMSGPMPGMATQDEIASLETLEPAEMDRTFFRLMITHHKGATDMAIYAAKHAKTPIVGAIARQMATSQSNEVDTMEAMLAERGG